MLYLIHEVWRVTYMYLYSRLPEGDTGNSLTQLTIVNDFSYKFMLQVQWFTKYNKSLASYMRTLGQDGLDLTQVTGVYQRFDKRVINILL